MVEDNMLRHQKTSVSGACCHVSELSFLQVFATGITYAHTNELSYTPDKPLSSGSSLLPIVSPEL